MKDPRNITRPNHERFDMTEDESIAFWLLICTEYPIWYIREHSFMLFTNTPLVKDYYEY